jgi:NAD(P)-dependent dehydrogenase (short-subunit alcohol dehydrogenase family)
MTTATEQGSAGTGGPLRGKVALVTGGTRGIGGAISHRLAADGADVGAGYWRHHEPAEKFSAEMTAAYPGRITVQHRTDLGRQRRS